MPCWRRGWDGVWCRNVDGKLPGIMEQLALGHSGVLELPVEADPCPSTELWVQRMAIPPTVLQAHTWAQWRRPGTNNGGSELAVAFSGCVNPQLPLQARQRISASNSQLSSLKPPPVQFVSRAHRRATFRHLAIACSLFSCPKNTPRQCARVTPRHHIARYDSVDPDASWSPCQKTPSIHEFSSCSRADLMLVTRLRP